jgi:Uma2 family endonuclease
MKTKLASKHWSDEQLMSLPDIAGRYELVKGRLIVMTPAGGEHGGINAELSSALTMFVRPRKLGWVLSPDTGFRMANDDVRSPDISFVSRARLKANGLDRLPRGFLRGAPDLAVEILSPKDSYLSTRRRFDVFFANGCRLGWIIRPKRKAVVVLRPDVPDTTLNVGDELDGGDVVPGFKYRIADLFADLDFE